MPAGSDLMKHLTTGDEAHRQRNVLCRLQSVKTGALTVVEALKLQLLFVHL